MPSSMPGHRSCSANPRRDLPMDEVEKHTALVLAAWLRSVHTQGAIFSGLLLVVATVAMALGATTLLHGGALNPLVTPSALPWSLALFVGQLVVLMPAERVLCLRLQLDAQLFNALGQGRYGLGDVDQSLLRIGLRPAQATTRSLGSRIAGTQRLVRLYTGVLAGQLVLALGTCVLAAYSVFCFLRVMP